MSNHLLQNENESLRNLNKLSVEIIKQLRELVLSQNETLEAARAVLDMSTVENNRLDGFARCDYCDAEAWSGHEEACAYRLNKDDYQAALARLKELK